MVGYAAVFGDARNRAESTALNIILDQSFMVCMPLSVCRIVCISWFDDLCSRWMPLSIVPSDFMPVRLS